MNKLFTELPAPKRTHRLSIVAVWNEIDPPEMKCEHAGCKQVDIEEITECSACGRWMCIDCWGGPNRYLNEKHCADCTKLTNDERQAIMDLREQLSH